MMLTRRETLKGITSSTFLKTDKPDIEINLYATESASGNAQSVHNLINFLHRELSFIWTGKVIHINICSLYEIGKTEGAKDALDKWDEEKPTRTGDCDVLLFPWNGKDWGEDGNWGYADIGGDSAVSLGADYMESLWFRNLALHEILHTFGGRHEWSDDSTIMSHNTPTESTEYSDKTLRKLRSSV